MVKSAYIHIPFCKSKCHYCSFISFNKIDMKEAYLKALKKEINELYQKETLNTLYFGGGTPSLLTIDELASILRLFNINEKTEITIEVNPDDVTFDYIRGLYDLGINRISMGAQTFDDGILKEINRRHSAGQIINAVFIIKNVGIKNISIDLIYGLPNQTIEMFNQDLIRAIDLGIQHISLYGLKIEEGSYFYKKMPTNLPDDDLQADMYLMAVEFLKNNKFEHYEFSNFSLKGFNSRHNINYWENEEYYGFGVAAHGYVNGIRYGNLETIEEYINSPLVKKESKILSIEEKLEEEIFLGLRKMSGIDIGKIENKYNVNFREKYNKIVSKYLKLGFFEETKTGITLTPQGVLVSNVILSEFID